jgi:hypothetical protein
MILYQESHINFATGIVVRRSRLLGAHAAQMPGSDSPKVPIILCGQAPQNEISFFRSEP